MKGPTSATGISRKPNIRLPLVGAFVIAAACLTSEPAMAESEHETTVTLQIEEIGQRLAEIELIEVTAEKTPVEPTEDVDAEIEAILDEAEAIEQDASGD